MVKHMYEINITEIKYKQIDIQTNSTFATYLIQPTWAI